VVSLQCPQFFENFYLALQAYVPRRTGGSSFWESSPVSHKNTSQQRFFHCTILRTSLYCQVEVRMASSTLNVLSGIAAAAAGFAGEKVSKSGSIPGLDLAAILPALLGNKSGGSGVASLVGNLASAALKSGALSNTKLGNIANLAGSLLSVEKGDILKKSAGGIEGLAATILGNSGSGTDLGSIAGLASKLAGAASGKKELTGLASNLAKTLSGGGVSFNGGAAAIKALDSVVEKGGQGDIFKSILKGLS
jgi:hypothetical protein